MEGMGSYNGTMVRLGVSPEFKEEQARLRRLQGARFARVMELRRAGLSWVEIGAVFGFTRQRAFSLHEQALNAEAKRKITEKEVQ